MLPPGAIAMSVGCYGGKKVGAVTDVLSCLPVSSPSQERPCKNPLCSPHSEPNYTNMIF